MKPIQSSAYLGSVTYTPGARQRTLSKQLYDHLLQCITSINNGRC
jgi:hypothetical protein